jgi:hypothetical protein
MVLLAAPAGAYAGPSQTDHLVSPENMQNQLVNSAASRQKNIDEVRSFLSSPVAEQAMRDAHYNPEQVQRAVSTLSDQELASLAARSRDAQQKFAAGGLTKTELGLIAIAFVVVIIVIIVH